MIKRCKQLFFIMLLGVVLLGQPIATYGSVVIQQKGEVGSQYKVQYEGKSAVLSRDGSEAVSVKNNTVITKPGTYYLNVWDKNNNQNIIRFTIKPTREKNTYLIKNEVDLEEAFKDILGNYKLNVKIQMEYGSFTADQLSQVFYRVLENTLAKYPFLTFEKYEMRLREGYKPLVEMTITYPDSVTNLKKSQEASEQIIEKMIENTMRADLLDYEREWLFYDQLVKRTTYSNQVINGNAPPLTHTIQGTLVDGVGVCDGYAKTLMYLLNAVGVQTRLIVGEARATNGDIQAHAWNLVKIQGQYYHTDITWGDVDEQQVGVFYDYFNETDAYMKQSHSWKVESYPKATSDKYSLVYMPMEIPGIYRANSLASWKRILQQMRVGAVKEGTIILSGTELLGKNDQTIINELMGQTMTSISYRIDKKYNAKIITYEMK